MQWLSQLGDYLHTAFLILEVILVFNLMIIVHELGHFLAARWRGLKIEAFYVWFGKPLWKKTINGVEYGLGSIPFGGFVKLPQMAPMDAIEGGSSSNEPLPSVTPLDKIIVAFAGPLFSFGLAVVFACLVMWLGKPESEHVKTTTIGYVEKDSAAAKANLLPGDKILAIDGHPIRRFEGFVDSVRWAVISSEGDNIQFTVERPGQPAPLVLPVSVNDIQREEKKLAWWEYILKRPELRDVGLAGMHTPVVGEVHSYSPADEAGIQAGDEILSVNGTRLLHPKQLTDFFQEQGPNTVQLLVKRHDNALKTEKEFTVSLAPRVPDVVPAAVPDMNRPILGIVWDLKGRQQIDNPPVLGQVGDASRSMYNMITKLVAAKSDISPAHMSGPVGIGRVYFNILQHPHALLLVLWFSVVLNINLAIMNMLPFPVLDGGHITLAVLEAIRRKPIQSRFLEVVQTLCALTLFGFLIFVTLKDVGDISLGGGKDEPTMPSFLPKDQRPAATAPQSPTPPAPQAK